MINIASDWREKRNSSAELASGNRWGLHDSFPWAFFGIHRHQHALLLYHNLHASLKVTPVYWPFDLGVFCSIIIIIIIVIYFLVVIRFPVKPVFARRAWTRDFDFFLFVDKSVCTNNKKPLTAI